jgi:hypothetical protein
MATAETSGEKTPKTASEKPLYTDDKAAWRVSKIQLIDPYGWHDLNPTEITRIQLKLATWFFENDSVEFRACSGTAFYCRFDGMVICSSHKWT